MSLAARIQRRWRQGIRHKVTPLGAMILTLLVTSGVMAFTTSQNVFFLLFSLLLTSILVSSFVNRLMLAGLEIHLDMPRHAMAGEPVACLLRIENRKSWLASFALELVAPVGRRFYVPIVQAAGNAVVPVEVVWSERGIPDPLIIELSTRFPFGFSVRRTRVATHIWQPLYPSIREQAGFAPILNQIIGVSGSLAASTEAEFSHLREYSAGDDWRRIAWGKSAASQSWIVREHYSSGEGTLHLWLDTSSPEFEKLVELAAYLVWELQYKNTKFVFSTPLQRIGVSGRQDAYTILEMLATIVPSTAKHPTHDSSLFVLSFHPNYLSLPDNAGDQARPDSNQRHGIRAD